MNLNILALLQSFHDHGDYYWTENMESVGQKLDMMKLTATDLGSAPGRPKRTTNTG